MDSNAFDALSRRLGQRLSRRRIAVSAVGVATAIGLRGPDASAGKQAKQRRKRKQRERRALERLRKACVAPNLWCDNACIDPQQDEAHCGQCGNACGTAFCGNGQCTCAGYLMCENPRRCALNCCTAADCVGDATCSVEGVCTCNADSFACTRVYDHAAVFTVCCPVGMICHTASPTCVPGSCPAGFNSCPPANPMNPADTEILCGVQDGLNCSCRTSVDGVTACAQPMLSSPMSCTQDAECVTAFGAGHLCSQFCNGAKTCIRTCAV